MRGDGSQHRSLYCLPTCQPGLGGILVWMSVVTHPTASRKEQSRVHSRRLPATDLRPQRVWSFMSTGSERRLYFVINQITIQMQPGFQESSGQWSAVKNTTCFEQQQHAVDNKKGFKGMKKSLKRTKCLSGICDNKPTVTSRLMRWGKGQEV